MGKMSLAEILNPSEWRRHQDRQLKIEIEGYKYQQRDAHHSDDMRLGYDKLNMEDRQHHDRMNALARRDDLDERRYQGALDVDRDRLNFDREEAQLSRETALEVERLRGQTSLDAINLQAHADIMRGAGMLPIQSVNSALQRGEDQNRAIWGAIADITRAKIQQKHAKELEDQREKHRSNERRHEIKMAVLNARLEREGFTHQEVTKIIMRLSEPSTAEASEIDLFNRFSKWYGNIKP